MRARAAAVYEQVLAGMSEAEREALHEGLKTIIANLAAAEQGCCRFFSRNRHPLHGLTALGNSSRRPRKQKEPG